MPIARLRLGDRLDYAIDAHADTLDTRFPPMMLLPLVEHAIESSTAGGRLTIAITRNGERLPTTIAIDRGRFLDGTAVARVRERLAVLFGSNATLVLRENDAEAVLEMPLESG